ncbi:MAG: hypothetical protein KA831_04435 [Pyrinomonadaceae bacterium]|nr:hypothetical protein [Pyrinomonadaceae bacterium]
MNYRIKNGWLTIFTMFLFVNFLCGQTEEKTGLPDEPVCVQTKDARDLLIDEADRDEFNTRRVEITGNTYTRGREFWKRMAAGMSEGDIFTRRSLEKSVKRVSKIRSIYPISMDNILVTLNRTHKQIDIVFCVIQKPQK